METTTATRVIHKYPLWPERNGGLIPMGAPKILSVGNQREDICVWAEVEPEAPRVGVRFWAIPTGDEIPESATFLGTVMLYGGELVFHIYHRIEP